MLEKYKLYNTQLLQMVVLSGGDVNYGNFTASSSSYNLQNQIDITHTKRIPEAFPSMPGPSHCWDSLKLPSILDHFQLILVHVR